MASLNKPRSGRQSLKNCRSMKDPEETKVLNELPNFLNTFGTKFTNCICCGEDFDDSLEGLNEESQRSRSVLKDICIKSVVHESKVLAEVALDKDSSFPFCSECVTKTILRLTEMYRQLQVVQEGFNEARYTLVSDLIRCYVKVFFDDQPTPHPTEESIFSHWRKCALRNTWEAFEEPAKPMESELLSASVGTGAEEHVKQQPKKRFDLSNVKIEVSPEDEVILEEAMMCAADTEPITLTDEDFFMISDSDSVADQVKQETPEIADEVSQSSFPSIFGLPKSLDELMDDDLAPISQVIENALGNFRPRPPASPPINTKSASTFEENVELQSVTKAKGLRRKVSKVAHTKVRTVKKQRLSKKNTKPKGTAVAEAVFPARRTSLRVRGVQVRSTGSEGNKRKSRAFNIKRGNPLKSIPSTKTRRTEGRRTKSIEIEQLCLSSSASVESTIELEHIPSEVPQKVQNEQELTTSSAKRQLRSSLGRIKRSSPSSSDKSDVKRNIGIISPDSFDAYQSHDDLDTEEISLPSPAASIPIFPSEADSDDEEFKPSQKKVAASKKKVSFAAKSNELTGGTKKPGRPCKPKSDVTADIPKQRKRGRPPKVVESSVKDNIDNPSDPNAPMSGIATKRKRKNRPAQCSVCGKVLCSTYNLTLHMRTHSGEKPYPCPYCPMRFLKPPNLRAHLLKHTREKQYCCELCGATFGYPQVLRSHKASLHKIYDHAYTFECNSSDGNCHKKYVTPGEMAKHLRQNHFVNQHADISQFCKIQCLICELNIPDMSTFNEHIKGQEHLQKLKLQRNAHLAVGLQKESTGTTIKSSSVSTPTTINNQTNTESRTVENTLPLDKVPFSQVMDRAVTLMSQWPKKCRAEGCEMMLSNEQNMRLHLKKCHRERNHICDICNKAFMEKSHLRQHKIIHLDAGEKPFCCDECDEKFNTLASLNRHKTKHTGEGLQNCKYCDKIFSKFKVYRKHMCIQHPEVYLSLEPVFCDCCYLTFRTQEELDVHVKEHEEFRCEQCGRLYEYRCELVRHIQNHDKPFKCEQCDKSWATEAAMKEHVERRHSKEKSFKCGQCGLAFYGEKWLQNHIDRMHLGKSVQRRKQTHKRIKKTGVSSSESSDENQDSNEGESSVGQNLTFETPSYSSEIPHNQLHSRFSVTVHSVFRS